MQPDVDGMVEFIRARLAEDEAAAADWRQNYSPQHPSLCDPDRMLAEVEAKRFLLEWAIAGMDRGGLSPVMGYNILAGLAVAYRSRPDYDPAWRPA